MFRERFEVSSGNVFGRMDRCVALSPSLSLPRAKRGVRAYVVFYTRRSHNYRGNVGPTSKSAAARKTLRKREKIDVSLSGQLTRRAAFRVVLHNAILIHQITLPPTHSLSFFLLVEMSVQHPSVSKAFTITTTCHLSNLYPFVKHFRDYTLPGS